MTLTTCSIQSLDVDRSERVASIRTSSHRHRLPQVRSQVNYPAPGLDQPDTGAAQEQASLEQPQTMQAARPLPMIDSDEALSQQAPDGGEQVLGAPPRMLGQLHSQPQYQDAVEPAQPQQDQAIAAPAATVTDEGVNMDAGLGVQAEEASAGGTSLAQEEARQIAETNPQQPLVGGIGTDNPVAYSNANPVAQPDGGLDPEQQELAPQSYPQQSSLAIGTGTERTALTLPRRQRLSGGQEVAMLPRPVDPLAGPSVDAPPQQPGVLPASEQSCRVALKRLGVQFRDETPIYNGPACGIPYPVKVYGFASKIAMKPAITLNCQVTLAFAEWVKNELNPSARVRYWSGIRTIIPMGGYSCRRMNSSARNPWSEHAHGNAIDVGKFVLNNGKQIDVRKPGFFSFREKGLLNAVRSESCRYFHTVLGPGSDPHHKDHFHFDLRSRKSGYRHCD